VYLSVIYFDGTLKPNQSLPHFGRTNLTLIRFYVYATS